MSINPFRSPLCPVPRTYAEDMLDEFLLCFWNYYKRNNGHYPKKARISRAAYDLLAELYNPLSVYEQDENMPTVTTLMGVELEIVEDIEVIG